MRRRHRQPPPPPLALLNIIVCSRGAQDASSRHAVFSFVAGTWRKDYRALLGRLALPTLVVSGRDVGAAGAGVGKAQPEQVDKTSYKGL